MATMKDRNKFPPGQWQVLVPEAGMQKPFAGSFSECVKFLSDFRAKNAALTKKNNWSLNLDDIANDVDQYNAQRMIAGGYFGFVDVEGSPPPYAGGASRSAFAGGAVAVGESALTGLAVYRELFTGKSKPVAREEAERRAAICAVCPQNNTKRSFKEQFVSYVAKGLTELVGIMHDMDFVTSHDKQLGTCEACECPLFGKVYVELPTIERNMKPSQRAKLDPRCWITNQPLAGS